MEFDVFNVFILVILFIYGTIFGSFLNVVIYRTPQKEQVVKGRSRCISCDHTLAWYDLFPIFSWLSLGGKCRYCKTRISPRYAIVESLCGLSYLWAFLELGLSVKLIFALVLFPILICLSFFDIDTGEIEYWCPVSIASLGFFALLFSLSDGFAISDSAWHQHLAGALIVSVPFAIMLYFGAMGGADVQLMAAAGLLLGWSIVPAALIGVFLGAIVGVVIKLTGSSSSQEKAVYEHDEDYKNAPKGTVIRFGPFLAIGITVAFLYGERIIGWYIRLMG